MVQGQLATVLYDYTGSDKRELSLKQGTVYLSCMLLCVCAGSPVGLGWTLCYLILNTDYMI